jgi:cytochrome c-type biogenesis protein CcmH/NrfF
MTLMNNKKIAIISLFALLLIPPLSVSAAPADDIAMHNLVRDMAAEGQSEDAIIGYFVSTYGAQVLASSEQASPSGEDSGQIAGVAPFIAVLFAGVIIYYVLSKWAGRAKAKR